MFDPSPSPAVRPRSTSQNVYELLKGDIVTGALKPGEVIRENELSQRLGLSRTPIREALLRLANLGLIDILPQSSTKIAPIRLARVRAAQMIREAVEVEVARRAAEAATDADLAGIANLVEDQETALRRSDTGRLFELDDEFHRAIYAAAGLAAVDAELEDVEVHLRRLRHAVADWPADGPAVIVQHKAILDALRARDGEGVAAATRDHLRAILPVIERLAAGTP